MRLPVRHSADMKVALISDIHGNLWALEAVLAHAAHQNVDEYWNLGDILSGPLDAAGTADRLLALGALTIAGNHERQLLACAGGPGLPSDEHAFRTTTPAHREWLRSLPATARPRPDVLLCHGTPHSDMQPMLETHERGRGMRIATHQESRRRLERADVSEMGEMVSAPTSRLIVCGHTHLPRVMQLDDTLVVNPGSVGLQAYDYPEDRETYYVDNGTPHASYAVVEEVEVAGATSRWQISFHRIAYDRETAAQLAERNDRPEWAFALRTGFALRA